jgi:hypothetical protein
MANKRIEAILVTIKPSANSISATLKEKVNLKERNSNLGK